MDCCDEIIQRLQELKDAILGDDSITIPLTPCGGDATSVEISGPRIEVLTKAVTELAGQNDQIGQRSCSTIASIPEYWQTRIGADRPQLIVQYGQLFSDGTIGPSKYQVSIPHYSGAAGSVPALTNYTKGQWMGIQTLSDNSKIIVNAVSISEADFVLDQMLGYVDGAFTGNTKRTHSYRKGEELSQIEVTPVWVKYHSEGQKNSQPDWVARVQ